MAALAESLGQPELIPQTPQDWALSVRAACAKSLGFDLDLKLTEGGEIWAGRGNDTLVIPTALDTNLWEREAMPGATDRDGHRT